MFHWEHSDRCRAEGDESEDGGGERVEMHAAGVKGLSWWLERNEKEAGQYRHLAHIRTIEMVCGTVTFIRAQSQWRKSERIPLLHALSWEHQNDVWLPAKWTRSLAAAHKTIWMAVKSLSTDSTCHMMACLYACVGAFMSTTMHEGKSWRRRRRKQGCGLVSCRSDDNERAGKR